ncbi:MAG: VWA domain-containing protein [Chitinophagaceae bacterium]
MLYEWFQYIEFKHTWLLPFLLLLPVIAWLRFKLFRSLKSSFTVSTAAAFRVKSARSFWLPFPFWLQLFSIACVLLALARPQIKDVQKQKKGEGIDIMLCIDVSGSMLSNDFTPNRLQVAKEMAAEFVRNRPVDRLGLVIFSGESFTQYPLSTDHGGLLEQIIGLRSGLLEDGTLIGEGLATSVQRLSGSRSKTKVVVLLTDGKEEAPDTRIIDPITALEIAKTARVKVYTIGMGSERAVAVSEVAGRKVDRTTPFIDETLLRRIAAQTGGAYFRAKNKENLQQIYEQIDRLEKSSVEISEKIRYDEQFPYFIGAALFLLAVSIILRYTLLRTFP